MDKEVSSAARAADDGSVLRRDHDFRLSPVRIGLMFVVTFIFAYALGIITGYFLVKSNWTGIGCNSPANGGSLESQNSNIVTPYATADEAIAIYDSLKLLDNLFRQSGVDYFAVGGTLIGAMRNQPPGTLRWDNTIDIGILDKEDAKFNNLINTPPFSNRFRVSAHNHGYNINPVRFLGKFTAPFLIKMFVYSLQESSIHSTPKYFMRNGAETWPTEYFENEAEAASLDCPFYDYAIRCPSGAENFLKRHYGDRIFTHAVRHDPKADRKVSVSLLENVNSGDLLPLLTEHLLQSLTFNSSNIRKLRT